jgi:lysophospholipase L1-like esterase
VPPESTVDVSAAADPAPASASALAVKDSLPTSPIVTVDTQRAHAAAMQRYVGDGQTFPDLVAVADAKPDDFPGAYVPLVHPDDGSAMKGFHAALRELVAGKRDKVRVAMYGASGTAADLGTGYVRTYLQTRFGAGGVGFVPLVPITRWYRHSEVTVRAHKGWAKEHAQIEDGRLDGNYGYLGASFYTTKKGRWAEVAPKKNSLSGDRISSFELHVLGQPKGGTLKIRVDGKAAGNLSTASDEIAPLFHRIDVEPGPHTLRVQTVGDGEVRVFGVVVESDTPGVVVDTLGVDGTRATNHVDWNERVWGKALQHRKPDLITFSYGTNESVDDPAEIPIETYRDQLDEVLARVRRLAPVASCLLMVPVDYPLAQEDGTLGPRPRLLAINEIQRGLAPRYGCAYWDGMQFMGGPGGMARFVEADPPMAKNDYLHFNKLGAARKGQAVCDALMLEYDAATD